MSEREISAEDALQVAQRALQKANENDDRVAELEDEVDDLHEELTAQKLRLSEIDDERDYAELTLDDKIGMVREHAFRRAVDGHGKHAMDYNDVMWEVFDGEPGAKHCYKLMRLAGEALGFEHVDPADDSQQLRVDAEAAQRGPAFFPENKTAGEGVN